MTEVHKRHLWLDYVSQHYYQNLFFKKNNFSIFLPLTSYTGRFPCMDDHRCVTLTGGHEVNKSSNKCTQMRRHRHEMQFSHCCWIMYSASWSWDFVLWSCFLLWLSGDLVLLMWPWTLTLNLQSCFTTAGCLVVIKVGKSAVMHNEEMIFNSW